LANIKKRLMKLSILMVLILFSQFCLGQTKINFGAEVGVSISQFPKNNSYNIMSTDEVMTNKNSIISPLFGLTCQLIIKKHLLLSGGIQYQMTGTKYHYHRDGQIPRIPGAAVFYYTHDIWENQTFHKLCLPLTIGYTFKLGKIQPAVFVGMRPNLFLTGTHYYKSVIDATDNTEDQIKENEYNPVSSDQSGTPIKRLNNQFLIGFSALIREQLKISLTYNQGTGINYSEYEQVGWEPHYSYFKNSDFGLNITYFLSPLTKKTSTPVK